ncbi:ATP-dependent helicase [Litorimonas sp. RW-G-Af-16]|uniref:ATP-dependent helicase n=1 Tax=Litorimonas sp. RW-G-Af-16 TaxID=3241168 RepID=UPI00390C7560
MSNPDSFRPAPPRPERRSISEQAMPSAPRDGRAMQAGDYLNGLNPEQRDAVLTTEGPLLVLAGAGTGKTRVLTCRLAHILENKMAYPSQILSVTFTNKAAREMRHRVGDLIGGAVEGLPWLGTFHSIAAKILRIHAELVGLKSSFTILDTDDQIRLLKQIIKAADIDEKRWTGRYLASLIDNWKNKGLTPDKLTHKDSFKFADGKGQELYKTYQERLKVLNACDFGDLLLHNLTLFLEHPDVLKRYHAKFRYLLVDEYQDTNVCQYLWLRLLAQGSQNICVVGDDDQSIYGWRGAEVDNILRFEKDFPGAKVVKLERNYRSTEHILGAASGLITANQDRLGKTLWTEDSGGHKVTVTGVWDAPAEARIISDEIESWRSSGRSYNDVAILVRASRQMRSFEERFIQLGLPYRVIGGPRFFERLEIRDAHGYLRVLKSNTDDLAFERIVNTPKRGIGATTIQKLQTAARVMGMSLENATRELIKTDEIRGKARTALRAFLMDVDRWRADMPNVKHTELAERILDESGYTQYWRDNKDAKSGTRLENLKELIQAMAEFETLDAYLEHVSLVMDVEKGPQEDEISLMTLHSAKGLEFPLVFLPGWEEGMFPSQKSMDENGLVGLEEERRLAYVGITRARENAKIYFAANRQVYGSWQSSLPSRFVDELPPQHVEAESETGYYDSNKVADRVAQNFAGSFEEARGNYNSPGWQRFKANRDTNFGRAPREIEGHAVKRPAKNKGANFEIGQRIFHQKFGYGRIKSADGTKLTVSFEKAGEKKVLDGFVEAV